MPIFKGLYAGVNIHLSDVKGNSCLLKYINEAPRLASSLIITFITFSSATKQIFSSRYLLRRTARPYWKEIYLPNNLTYWWQTSQCI